MSNMSEYNNIRSSDDLKFKGPHDPALVERREFPVNTEHDNLNPNFHAFSLSNILSGEECSALVGVANPLMLPLDIFLSTSVANRTAPC